MDAKEKSEIAGEIFSRISNPEFKRPAICLLEEANHEATLSMDLKTYAIRCNVDLQLISNTIENMIEKSILKRSNGGFQFILPNKRKLGKDNQNFPTELDFVS